MPIDEETDAWLRRIGERLLARRDEITALANERIAAQLPTYQRLVPPSDLEESGRQILGLVLAGLAGSPPADGMAVAVNRGRLRQRQGIALEDVLRAIRLDFAVLWTLIVEEAATTPDAAAVSALAMLRVWDHLDEAMVAITEGFRFEEALVDRDMQARRSRLFHALAASAEPDANLLASVSDVLGFQPNSALLVVAGRLGTGLDYRLEMRWRSLGAPAYVGPIGVDTVGITVNSHLARRVLEEMVAGEPERVAVVAPTAEGVRSLYRAISVARVALRGAQAGQVHDSRDLFVEALVAGGGVIVTTLVPTILGKLYELPANERDRVFETLESWLVTDGGTAQVAHNLNRHRNTVINHLRRASELTELSLSSPSDIATLVLALKATHLPD